MEQNPDAIARLIARALDEGPFTIRQLAAEAGISYDSLYSWAKGRRIPRGEHLEQLARGFDRRADALRELSQSLRSAGESM